jgi:hypothetical protein
MRRITKAALVGGAAAAAIAATVGVASPANATDGYDAVPIHRVHVEVYWTGSNCLQGWTPVGGNHNSVGSVTQCNYSHQLYWDYAAAPGEWIGVDPEMGSNASIACSVSVDGYGVASDSALAGDGHEASCLVRL